MLVNQSITPVTAGPGAVYGTLMNDPAALAALGDAVHAPPYKAPPQAPVLFVKPRNTWLGDRDVAVLPADVEAYRAEVSLGLVIGRTACRVPEAAVLDHLAGVCVVVDLCVPHASFYRPSVRHRARDGSCRLSAPVPLAQAGDPDARAVAVDIDGVPALRSTTAGRVRGAARLLQDVTAFMTLQPGDVLMLGAAADAPLVRAGQRLDATIDGVGRLTLDLMLDLRRDPIPEPTR
jgi:5-oxopent-3-ene-1,2,5-tricarboxylate decarboxylase/2-hydroxyhepta-2,4-diene-1,7-dioate isomerase